MRQPTDFLSLINPPPEPARKVDKRLGLPQPCILPETLSLIADSIALTEAEPGEPRLAAGPFFVEFTEPPQLDASRTDEGPVAPTPATTRQAILTLGISLALHAATVLWLVTDTSSPPELKPPIPISLVLEKPPPEPPGPEPPAPESPPPSGPLASEDLGNPEAAPAQTGPTPPPPVEAPVAAKPAMLPPPLPPPPPPKPNPPPERVAAATPPKPATPVPPAPPVPSPATIPLPRPEAPAPTGGRRAATPGPSATRDEYLAYLVTLTRQHSDEVPMSLIGDRHGETSLGVIVLADGRIARISILRSSGYPDIDEHIEKMVAAVGRFPPLPQWYQGESMDLVFRLRFPEGLRPR